MTDRHPRTLRARPLAASALALSLLGWVACLFAPSSAHAWDFFQRENPDVSAGNRAMADEDYEGALEAYARAAQALPEEPRVQLNRGLAMLERAIQRSEGGQGLPTPQGPAPQGPTPQGGATGGASGFAEAREALVAATGNDAPVEVRADALYNLGLAFYHEGDQLAATQDHEGAQAKFREAVDALRRSLRARPGDEDTAWNYELAVRRLQEQEQAAEQQRQQEQQEQEEEQEGEPSEEGEDGEQTDQEQESGGEDGEEQEQPGDEEGDQEAEPEPDPSGDPEQQGGDEEGDEPDDSGEEPQSQETGSDEEEPGDQGGEPQDPGGDSSDSSPDTPPEQSPAEGEEALPSDVSRVLDSLRNSEENLQRYRARDRARRENRRPNMDW